VVGQAVDIAGEDARTRVFLSYSRRDAALVARVAEGLLGAGFLADYDQAAHDPGHVSAGIAAEDEWWKRLQEMIASADVMVFLVSPDSAQSAVCDEEIAYARALGKRILAVLARPVDFARAPPRLSALNVRIDFSEGGPGFEAALAQAVSALEMNVGWHREGRKYFARVQEWDTAGRPKSRLLREGAVEEAERWALARPRNEPEPGELFLAWIAASRTQIRRDAAVRAFWRRVTAIFVLTTLIVTVAGAWFVVGGQRNLGRSESLMLARTSDQFYNAGDHLRALQLAILASRETFLSPSTDEAKAAFAKSAQALQLAAALQVSDDPAVVIERALPVAGGRNLLVVLTNGAAELWSLETAQRLAGPFSAEGPSNGVQVSVSANGMLVLLCWGELAYGVNAETGASFGPIRSGPDAYPSFGLGVPFSDGSKFLLRDQKDGISLRDGVTGERIAVLAADGGMVTSALVSEDGRRALLVSEASQQFWDLETHKPVSDPAGFEAHSIWQRVLSPGGDRLVMSDYDDDAAYFDTTTGEAIPLGGAATAGLNDAVFVPELNRLVMLNGRNSAEVRDMTTGALIGAPQPCDSTSEGLAASVGGGHLICMTYLSGTRVIDLETGRLLSEPVEGQPAVTAAVLLPGTDAFLSWDGRDVHYHLADGEAGTPDSIVTEHPGFIEDVVPSPDGRTFLTYTSEGEVRQWDTESGMLLNGPLAHTNYTSRGGYIGDGSRILTVDGGRAFVWLASGYTQSPAPALDEGEAVTNSLLSPDGRFELGWNTFGLGVLWNVAEAKAVGPGILTGEDGFWGAAFDPAGAQLALWFENQLQLIPTATGIGAETLLEHRDVVTKGAFTEEGTRLVTVDSSGTAYIWDTAALAAVGPPLPHEGYDLPPMDPIRKRMVYFAGAMAMLTDLETGLPIGAPMEHLWHGSGDETSILVTGAAFSGDGAVLVTFNSDELRLWDAATGAPRGGAIMLGESPVGAVLSGDGQRVLVFMENRAEVFDTASGASVSVLAAGVKARDGVLSADGRIAATWGDDAQLRLWDAGAGKQIGNAVPTGLIEQAGRFTPAARRLLLSEPTGTYRIVDTATADVVATLDQFSSAGGSVWQAAEGALVTHRHDGEVHTWDISWAMRLDADAGDVAAVCSAKLAGTADGGGVPFVRRLDGAATFAAPILRGREGEDVCTAPEVAWWERAAGAVFGWMWR